MPSQLQIPLDHIERVINHFQSYFELESDFSNFDYFKLHIDGYEHGDYVRYELSGGILTLHDREEYDCYDLRRNSFYDPLIEAGVPFNFWHDISDEYENLYWYRPEFFIQKPKSTLANGIRAVFTAAEIKAILESSENEEESFSKLAFALQENDPFSVQWDLKNYRIHYAR